MNLIAKPTLKLGLSLKSCYDKYCLFNTQEEIKDKNEWEGCSGSPIFDDSGKLVAMTLSVNPNSKSVFGLSVEYCRSILDKVI